MSTAVGLIHEGKIYLGADGRATTDTAEIRPLKATKLFRSGPYLVAYIGSVRTGQVLMPSQFEFPDDILDLPDFMRVQFAEKGCLERDENGNDQTSSNLLIGHKSKLYELLTDFQMNEIEDYGAIGAGCHYSYGSLYTSEGYVNDPKKRVKMALEAAAEFNALTGPPFKIEML